MFEAAGCGLEPIWGFPKIRGTFWVPIRRTIIFWGLYWGPAISGNYHLERTARASRVQGLGPKVKACGTRLF